MHFIRSINITMKCNEIANKTNYNMVTTSGVWKPFEFVSDCFPPQSYPTIKNFFL